jgi:hypothetical protein
VEAFLDRTVGGGRVQFSVVRSVELRLGEADAQVSIAATARAIQPLYSKMASAEYLRQTFNLNPESAAEARRLLADRASLQAVGLTDAGPLPADPYQAVILKMDSPPGTPFNYQGVIFAHRAGGTWTLSLASGGFEGSAPQGRARSVFGDNSFAAGDSGDDARLRALVSDFQAFASRVADRQKSLESAEAESVGRRRAAFLAQITPGSVLRGEAFEAGSRVGTPLYLEFTELSEDKQVSALLRNDGGWSAARVFQGTWTSDDDFQSPVLNLTSPPDQAVRNGGPFLENTQVWTLALGVDPRGGLSQKDAFFEYRFQSMSPDQASALKARLEAEYVGAMAATRPDLLYEGVATSRDSGATEPVLLRFTGRPTGGGSVDARLESPTRSWRRPLRGAIASNARRSGGRPVVLRTGAAEAVEDAPPDSVMGARQDLELRLGLESGSLVGGDEKYTYRFDIAGASDLSRMRIEAAERAHRFLGVFRNGIVYDGILREEQGFVAGARLEIMRIDRRTGAIAARMHSVSQPNVFREFLGTCDPAGDSVMLGATGRGVLNTGDDFDAPFFKSAASSSVHLELAGTSITGGIEGDTSWIFEFPAGAFLSAPAEDPEDDSPAGMAVFPTLPKGNGAYLLSRGAWAPMPTNQSHIVVEAVGPKSEPRLPTNLVDAVQKGLDQLERQREKQKVSYLEFPGTDPRPASAGQAIVILFAGPRPPGTAVLELAPAELTKDGKRRVEIVVGPEARVRFGEKRLSAYVRQIAPGYILLTTTSAVAPGSYVLNADRGYELMQE